MTMRSITNQATTERYRSRNAQEPHVGECTFAGARALAAVKQRDGSRVSAAGDAR
jgi:hypothetical protein